MKDKIFNDYFKVSQTFDLVKSILTFAMLIFSIVQVRYSIFYERDFTIFTALFIIVKAILENYQINTFNKGNKRKLDIFIDNSFGTKKIPCYNSDNYYNNEEIELGATRMLANVHENTFFTSKISNISMIVYSILTIISVIILSYLFLSYGLNEISALLLNFLITGTVLEKTIKYKDLYNKTVNIFERCNDLCSDLRDNKELNFYPRVITLFVEYESVKYESKIVLSEKLFNKLNSNLSKEWEDIKSDYDIYKKYNE